MLHWMAIIVALICLYVFYIMMKSYNSPTRHIPGPKGFPMLGHSLLFYTNQDNVGLHEKWSKEFKQYGMYKIQHVGLFGFEQIFLLKPEWIKHVLSRPDDFPRTSFLSYFLPLLGEGLLISSGEEHRFQKRLLAKAFTLNHLKHYVGVFDEHAHVLVDKWKDVIKDDTCGRNIDIREYTCKFSLDIISEIGFGFDYKTQTTKQCTLVTSFLKQVDVMGNLKRRTFEKIFPFFHQYMFGYHKIAEEDVKKTLHQILSERKRKITENCLSESESYDLLSIMIGGKDENTGRMFTDQLIKNQTLTFLLAGFETTATALPIVLLYFAQYPELQEKARKEVMAMLDEVDGSLSQEDIQKIPYTSAFIKESIRLNPPLPVNVRQTNKDCKFGDYNIPKGTILAGFVSIVNRDPEKFDYPDEFIPERYMDESSVKAGQSLTFGFGPYNCIGKTFAIQELQIAIVRLLQNFTFTVDDGMNCFSRKYLVSIRFTPAIVLRIQKLHA